MTSSSVHADAAPEADSHAHHAPQSFWSKYIFSVDHKIIGLQYTLTGIFMAVVGVYMSYVFRMHLANPAAHIPFYGVLSPAAYNSLVTNHGTIMIFWVAMPILLAGLGNYCIPLMIGCDDMVFPRVNRLSFQVFFLSTVLLLVGFMAPGGAFGGAWTSYPPLSAKVEYNLTPHGNVIWLLAVALEIVAFLLGGINFVTTAMNSRAKGMKMFDMPVLVWMIVIATIIFMMSVGPLVAGAVMLLLDQTLGTHFFAAQGGDPVLWQHLFWFFGHPEVYVLLLPELGVVCEIICVFSRKPLFGYKTIVYTTFMVGILSMIVWAHHQFIAGIDPRMASIFSLTTIIISIPVAVIMFAMIATLFKGSIEFKVPMLWAIGLIVEFLLGGVTGIYLGSSALDVYFHDTYFVVAHFHYTLIPLVAFGGFAIFTYYFPKVTGKMLDERLGRIHFWGSAIAFNFIFIPLFFSGLAGEHRRIYDYSGFAELTTPHMQSLRTMATHALLVMIAFQIPFVINVIKSLLKGAPAGANPWKANTLEWTADSPPPHGNWAELPEVYRGPYEYSVPGREQDYWPQNAAN
ncbi:MAG: cbb3-type cytochrome c oxidase subunit I [Verrucomicrobiaceae bacterium]|nr:cbb3-type cytochrome c oxidase subunit I [Verrucomicrobiaceae bacterium]